MVPKNCIFKHIYCWLSKIIEKKSIEKININLGNIEEFETDMCAGDV
jgi:hypothetical protein